MVDALAMISKEMPEDPRQLFGDVLTGKYKADPWENLAGNNAN
eukprot:CAMPEP_0114591038 /NCGR_PEP_ID=MMETSP0125-20121206/13183_1 /TAXON_ID=485358 ORGANISM="Aristerostoma sp., Strain ATCC 50986" /NCGR_SAMPLE_ID=MMETSP0125 /ASSEMBLY_ACC=CAM_ASM_000245 /LENGTH=42 /DNA_ID= /DNA_START= /DNA_END= /DNA_ORIENTATION=